MTWDAAGTRYTDWNGDSWDHEGNLRRKKKPPKWTHWPHYPGFFKELRVLACEDTWQAEVEMWFDVAAEFFYTTFIPSPVELSRKLVSGAYKCGFYLPIKLKSPLDVVWKDGKTSKALLQINSPATRGLFMVWAMGAAWGALAAWQSVPLAQAMCDADGHECLLRAGENWFPGTDPEGAPGFFEVIYDPAGRYVPPGGGIDFEGGALSSWAGGHITNSGPPVTSYSIQLWPTVLGAPEIFGGAIAPGEDVTWHYEWTGNAQDNGTCQHVFKFKTQNQGRFSLLVTVDRWTVRTTVDPWEPYGPGSPGVPPSCVAANQPPFGQL